MRWVEVSGIRIGFEQVGKGPPLILVHWAVSDGRVWQHQLDALQDEFTVVAWDAPGCGRSADPPESLRLDALSSILVTTLFVHGDADERSPLTVADDLHRSIPTSSLVVLSGLGHECYLEDPDSFNAEVRSFLRAHS